MWEVEYLEADLALQAQRLEAFEQLYSNSRILSPCCLDVSCDSSIWQAVSGTTAKVVLFSVVQWEQPNAQTRLLIRDEQGQKVLFSLDLSRCGIRHNGHLSKSFEMSLHV